MSTQGTATKPGESEEKTEGGHESDLNAAEKLAILKYLALVFAPGGILILVVGGILGYSLQAASRAAGAQSAFGSLIAEFKEGLDLSRQVKDEANMAQQIATAAVQDADAVAARLQATQARVDGYEAELNIAYERLSDLIATEEGQQFLQKMVPDLLKNPVLHNALIEEANAKLKGAELQLKVLARNVQQLDAHVAALYRYSSAPDPVNTKLLFSEAPLPQHPDAVVVREGSPVRVPLPLLDAPTGMRILTAWTIPLDAANALSEIHLIRAVVSADRRSVELVANARPGYVRGQVFHAATYAIHILDQPR